ncbi:uncharacterized protein LOC117782917 [Drosophila innubila]|uniref:uncharacterized protein LOC117782917 n=1 Tax=Drosophila innubila TaxID=198719 RepID=UPI00148D1D65|nr:uncharacterized protein LOC117782917 [Drosophila innubila]
MPPKHRDISPFLQFLRDFLLGRKHVTSHRYADTLSPRSLPAPTPPESSMNRISGNAYYLRDARSQVKPPIDLVEEKKRQLAAIAAEAAKAAAAAEDTKKAPKDASAPKAAPKPTIPPKTCKQDQTKKDKSKPRKMLPTPGQLHKWD